MRRITAGVERPPAIEVAVDGQPVAVHPGETVAVAILSAGTLRMRDDRAGAPRGMFCNMGTCSECTVWIRLPGGEGWARRRGCLQPVLPGMAIRTLPPEARA